MEATSISPFGDAEGLADRQLRLPPMIRVDTPPPPSFLSFSNESPYNIICCTRSLWVKLDQLQLPFAGGLKPASACLSRRRSGARPSPMSSGQARHTRDKSTCVFRTAQEQSGSRLFLLHGVRDDTARFSCQNASRASSRGTGTGTGSGRRDECA